MRTAIAKHVKDFVAIIVLILISIAVASVILSNQRLTLPGWVPVIGKSFYTLRAEMSTAQAVTPGQGQTVDIAGVPVGEIKSVDLRGGRALVTMTVKKKYDRIYPNASILLRPKTGLKDMIAELDPGTPSSGKPMPSGSTIPISQTLPDVNLDEILAALDADSRSYLQLLVHGAGQGLRGNGPALQAVFKRFDPTLRDLRRVNNLLSHRSANVRRAVHNFSLLTAALAGKDRQLSTLVDSSNAVFKALADQDANLRRTIRDLPGTLQLTRTALNKTTTLASTLGPTLQSLRPGARALGPSLRRTRPFVRAAAPIVKDELRPFTRAALPTIKALRPAARDLSALTPDLVGVTKVVNYALNEVAWDPPGNGVGQQAYLFYQAWVNHDGNSVFSNQDAHGPIRRGQVLFSCSTIALLKGLAGNPIVGPILTQTGLPQCPSAGAGGATAARAATSGKRTR
jgi:phospholipid/cholesterol/gamma-HCH transport system substrate-binding protein